jgi:hypothetical protein
VKNLHNRKLLNVEERNGRRHEKVERHPVFVDWKN